MAQDINIKIGANITDLQKKLGKAQRSLERSGKKMSALGNDLMMSVSVPLGLFGASIIGTSADFEKGMKAMKAVTDGGAESFSKLSEKAKEFGANVNFSATATDAAQAMEMLGRNGLNATEILNGAAEASIILADATDTQLANSANIATDAMAQFGLKATDLVEVADLITGATVNSKFSIDDFQYAMASAGGVAGAVGVSFKDFATTVSAISPSFASGSDAGTSLKTMLTNLVPASAAAEKEMSKLGIITANGTNQFFDAAGNMKSMSDISGILQESFKGLSEAQTITAAKTIFGTDAMRAGLKMAEVGSKGFDKLATSIEGVSAAEVAGIRMEGFHGAVVKLKKAFETLQLAIADAGVLDFATNFVNSLTAMSLTMAELNPEVLKLAVGFGAALIAIGPLIKMIGISKLLYGQLLGNINILVGAYGRLQAVLKLVYLQETRSLLITKAKDSVLKMYNVTLNLSTKFLNLFRLSTYKNIAASVAQKVAQIAVNVATFAGVAIIQTVIAAEAAYLAVKLALANGINIAAIAQKAFNLVLMANPIGLAIIAIFALVAAFTAAYQNLDWFRAFVDKSLNFITEKFQWLMDSVKYVFLNFPAILNATWAAFKQFAKNITNSFKRLSLSAESFRLKFARALTIDKDKRAEITKQINSIGSDKNALKKNAVAMGTVFRETLAKEVKKISKKKIINLDTPISDFKMDTPTPSGAAGGGNGGGNGGGMASAITKTTKAIKDQKTAITENAAALTTLETKQLSVVGSSDIMANSVKSLESGMRSFRISTDEMKAVMASFNESLTSTLNQGLADVAGGFGEVAGAMASGTASMSDMGAMLLGTLGGLLGQVGKLAISTGIAMLGIKTALQSLNPAVAIAGGIALVALSKVVSSKAQTMGGEIGGGSVPAFANGGLVDKPTFGVFGEAGPEVLIPKKRLDSLLSGFENGGGGMGVLSTRIRGNDLEVILDKTKRRNNRVR